MIKLPVFFIAKKLQLSETRPELALGLATDMVILMTA